MYEIAKQHNIKFSAITTQEFEDCEEFQKLSKQQPDDVLECAMDELEENLSYVMDNAINFAENLANE